MADNVQVNSGTGPTALADERSIAGVTGLVQRVGEIGGTAFATGQVAPTGTAATLLAARETRKSVLFINRGSVDVFIGPATVTTANGLKLSPGESVELGTTALIQAITAGVTGSIHYEEDYDS